MPRRRGERGRWTSRRRQRIIMHLFSRRSADPTDPQFPSDNAFPSLDTFPNGA